MDVTALGKTLEHAVQRSGAVNPLVALALATPVWGFALQPPAAAAPSLLPDSTAQIETSIEMTVVEDTDAEIRNATWMEATRWLQLVSTVGLGVTGVLGAIQFGDEYGFNDSPFETACATGDSVFDYCGRSTPWPHLIAAGSSAVIGLGALVASTQVDYDRASRRDGDWRTFEVTRWIGFGLNIVQAVAGALIANAIRFEWVDEQRDFDTMQALAFGHLLLGGTIIAFETFNTILLF